MLAASLFLSACAPTIVSRSESLPLPVAERWDGATSQAAQTGAQAYSMSWREYILSPTLRGLIETALSNNRDLQVALLRVEEARATYAIQRSDLFPAIDAGGQAARGRTPADLSGVGQAVTAGNYRVDVGLSSWEVDLWGRISNLKEAALQEYLATEQAQRAVRSTLIAEVSRAYLALRELDERLLLTRETIATREETYRIFSRRYEVGASSALELAQVETLLVQARTLGAQLEQARAQQAHALVLLLGAPVELPTMYDGQPALTQAEPSMFADVRVGIPAELLTTRPDIVAAEHRLVASQANIQAARAAFFPSIRLTGALGTASAELSGLFDGGSGVWNFVPSLGLPIFDGGRRRANLDLAEVRSDIAVANYEKTIQNAFREVADALSDRQWLSQQVDLNRQALNAQNRRARLAKLRYDSGAVTYLEVLDAQRDLLDTQQALVQSRYRLQESYLALYTALGGGAAESDVFNDSPTQTSNTP